MGIRLFLVALAAASVPLGAGAQMTAPHRMAVLRPCASPQLRAAVASTDSGMQHRELRIRMTNMSSKPCAVDGFPAVRLLDAARNVQIVAESFSRTPRLFIVAPHHSAIFALRIATGDGVTTYRTVPAIAIVPPGDVTAVVLLAEVPVPPVIDVSAMLPESELR